MEEEQKLELALLLFFVRHAERSDYLKISQNDEPITDLGVKQA